MRKLLVALVLVAAVPAGYLTLQSPAAAPARAAASIAPPRTLLAIRWHRQNGELIRLNGRTLEQQGGKTLPVGRYTWGWSFSPDRSELVLAREQPDGLRFVDPATLRRHFDLPLPAHGYVRATDWIGPHRLLVLAGVDDARDRLFLVDPAARRILSAQTIDGQVEQVARSSRKLVLLLAPRSGIGAARLLAIGADGRVAAAPLTRILAGQQRSAGSPLLRGRSPGLAVDPAGGRAFVVTAGAPVAEIALATMRVGYHQPTSHRSLADRVAAWLVPPAQAKGITGPQRQARWLGNGLLALTGVDDNTTVDANGTWHYRFDPAGLTIVDTRNWITRKLDGRVTVAWPMGGTILALRTDAPGSRAQLVGYGLDGKRLYTSSLEPNGVVYADAPYAYVETMTNTLALLDGRTGRLLAKRGAIGLTLLASDAIDNG